MGIKAITQAEVDAHVAATEEAEAETMLNVSPREKAILKQIFLLRKVSEPDLTKQEFIDELKADYKASK